MGNILVGLWLPACVQQASRGLNHMNTAYFQNTCNPEKIGHAAFIFQETQWFHGLNHVRESGRLSSVLDPLASSYRCHTDVIVPVMATSLNILDDSTLFFDAH
jgi:hypothetical protein